jgi:putative membrane protein
MFKQSVSVAAACLLILAAPVVAKTPLAPARPAADAQAQHAGTGDQMFASDAAIAGMAEVELGTMAAQQGSSAKVKSFGMTMVTDHAKAGNELKSIAAAKGITLPTMLDPMHQATRDKLAKLSGTAFDRAYMDAMVAGSPGTRP